MEYHLHWLRVMGTTEYELLDRLHIPLDEWCFGYRNPENEESPCIHERGMQTLNKEIEATEAGITTNHYFQFYSG